MKKADSITGVKLKKWMVEKPHLFNRFKTSYYGTEMIGILMIHAGWNNLKSVQDTLFSLTKRGLIHRSIFASMIERQALYNGSIFYIDSISKKVMEKPAEEKMEVCNHIFYSSIFVGYGRIVDKNNQFYLLPPTRSSISDEDINKFRKRFFYSDLNLLYSNPKYKRVSRKEYCNYEE